MIKDAGAVGHGITRRWDSRSVLGIWLINVVARGPRPLKPCPDKAWVVGIKHEFVDAPPAILSVRVRARSDVLTGPEMFAASAPSGEIMLAKISHQDRHPARHLVQLILRPIFPVSGGAR